MCSQYYVRLIVCEPKKTLCRAANYSLCWLLRHQPRCVWLKKMVKCLSSIVSGLALSLAMCAWAVGVEFVINEFCHSFHHFAAIERCVYRNTSLLTVSFVSRLHLLCNPTKAIPTDTSEHEIAVRGTNLTDDEHEKWHFSIQALPVKP